MVQFKIPYTVLIIMFTPLTRYKKKELATLKKKGSYAHKEHIRVREDYIALIALKYLYYTNMPSWRRRTDNKYFADLNLTDGEWKRAIRILNEMDVLLRDSNRWVCKDKQSLLKGIKDLEKRIVKKYG